MANKPEIRFKEFSDEWEEIHLNEISERITRKNENLESSLPLTISAQYGLVDQRDFFNAQIASKDVSGYFLLKKGEFAYNKSYSSEYPLGAIKRLDNYDMGVLSTLYILFSHKNIESDFLLNYYDSNYWHKEIIKVAAEGARNHGLLNIAPEDFFSTKLKIAPSFKEQKAIGEFFDHISSLISSTQEKHDKAIILKKSMLEKMFPKDGAKVPELRFAGFSGDWEDRDLSEITYRSGEKNTDNLPLQSYSITNESGFIPQDAQFENGGNMFTADKTMYWIVTPKSFAYNPARINVGSIGYYDGKNNVIVSSLYEIFKIDDCCDSSFLTYWFKTNTFQKLIERLQEGGVRLYFYYDKLCMGNILLPRIEEQQKIGQFFVQLDKTISSYKEELEKLKTIKKSLLEKMFV